MQTCITSSFPAQSENFLHKDELHESLRHSYSTRNSSEHLDEEFSGTRCSRRFIATLSVL